MVADELAGTGAQHPDLGLRAHRRTRSWSPHAHRAKGKMTKAASASYIAASTTTRAVYEVNRSSCPARAATTTQIAPPTRPPTPPRIGAIHRDDRSMPLWKTPTP